MRLQRRLPHLKLRDMARVTYFLTIVLLSFLCPWWATILVSLPYFYLYRAYELVVLAILVDGYHGAVGDIPVFSMIVSGVLILSEWSKPYISFRSDHL